MGWLCRILSLITPQHQQSTKHGGKSNLDDCPSHPPQKSAFALVRVCFELAVKGLRHQQTPLRKKKHVLVVAIPTQQRIKRTAPPSRSCAYLVAEGVRQDIFQLSGAESIRLVPDHGLVQVWAVFRGRWQAARIR